MTTLKTVVDEIKEHAPFTMFGAVTGIAIMAAMVYGRAPKGLSSGLFWTLHPLHVLFSALATAGMYRLHGGRKLLPTIIIGYLGSVGIATISDSVIPYLGELLLDMPNAHTHIGFIEKWWLINPLALVGIVVACRWPKTKVPHAGHVLLSTWASLFHMTMAIGEGLDWVTLVVVPLFLFLAVWIPCCLSDIVFPLLFCGKSACTCHQDAHEKD